MELDIPASACRRLVLPPTVLESDLHPLPDELRRLARDPGVRELRLDAHAVRDVTARGLGLLLAVSRIAAARGALVTIDNVRPGVEEMLVSTGLSRHLRYHARTSEDTGFAPG